MNNLVEAIRVEFLKARRSQVPLFTALGFSLVPFAGGFFMIIYKDPDLARRMGLISAKAQLAAGSADWPTYLSLIAQAVAVGGLMLFALIASWVFGREYIDHTLKDLLALPTSRSTIVFAKFVIVAGWSAALTVLVGVVGLVVGAAVNLPPESTPVLLEHVLTIILTACLTVALMTPVAFFASAGRGYLAPMGFAMLTLFLAQIVGVAGYGEYFPWAVPALFSGGKSLGAASFVIVALLCLAGMAITLIWWERADQTH